MLISSGGLGREVSYALRAAATLPGADPIVAAVTRRAMTALPLVSRPDVGQLADVLSGLRDSKQRTAFIRIARSLIVWRGQAVSAQRQTGLLHGVPVVVAWGNVDTTIPPHHHRAFATRVPEAVAVEIAGGRAFPARTHSALLLEPILTFLSSTVPFEYCEPSWVDRLTHAGQNQCANGGSSIRR